MISLWFIFALSTSFSLGIIAFINKIFAERKYDQKFSAMILSGILLVFAIIYVSITGFNPLSLQDIIIAILWGIQIYLYNIIMMTTLRYIPTSTFFINVRLLSSFSLLIVGIIFFKDIISLNETIGFILGIFAMLLLFEKETKKDTDYKKGIIFLLLGVLALIFGHSVSKFFSYNTQNISSILLVTFIAQFLFAFIFGYKTIKVNKNIFKPLLYINFIQAGFYFFYFIVLFYVYKLGNLGISYKIQSYSPFIPIILSAIVYKEKITTKKKIALILTIISLWFFM